MASNPRRSSRLASIAGAAGDAEPPGFSGFVTPAHPGGRDARSRGGCRAAVRRGARGARGVARGEYDRRESLDGEPSSRRSSEELPGADVPEPNPNPNPAGLYPRGYPVPGDPLFGRTHTRDSHTSEPNPVLLAPGRFAEGALALRALLAPLAAAAAHLSMFRGAECVSALSRLDPRQRDTGYALCLLGKAHAEMVAYPRARARSSARVAWTRPGSSRARCTRPCCGT